VPDPSGQNRPALGPGLAKIGVVVAAFAVFTCGWLAMHATDWRYMILFTALALVAGAVASAFARNAR
jgi:hypothetical protein